MLDICPPPPLPLVHLAFFRLVAFRIRAVHRPDSRLWGLGQVSDQDASGMRNPAANRSCVRHLLGLVCLQVCKNFPVACFSFDGILPFPYTVYNY